MKLNICLWHRYYENNFESILSEEVTHDSLKMLTVVPPKHLIFL